MTITVADIDVEGLLRWSKEKEVTVTKGSSPGPKLLRKARPTEEFWELWNAQSETLKRAGVSVRRDDFGNGDWQVLWWRDLPREELERRARSAEMSSAKESKLVVPVPEGCVPRPYQIAAVEFAIETWKRNGVLLADEMGLGKSIDLALMINALPEIHRVLVITKAGLKLTIRDELEKWLTRPLSIGVADANCFPTTDVVVVNFDVCHKWTKRMEFYWDLVAIDEAHRLGNPKTRRAKSIIGYKPTRSELAAGVSGSTGIPARRKLLMTGSPFENRPVDLWPLLWYLLGDRCPSKSSFQAKYCDAKMTSFGWQANGASNLEQLRTWLRSNCMIRRLKSDVEKELPPKTRIVVEMDSKGLDDVLRKENQVCEKYERELADAQFQLELAKCLESDEEYHARVKELKGQFFVPFDEIAKVRHATALAKLPLVIEALKDDLDEAGPKIVVFGHHTDVLVALHREFPDSVLVTGDIPKAGPNQLAQRHAIVKRFQTDPKCGPFFGSIRATGEGLTLTAASLCAFVESDWVPGRLSQCEDRLHRIGQKSNVLAKHLTLKGSYDAKMLSTTVRKQQVFDTALDRDRDESLADPILIPKHESLCTRTAIRIESSIVSLEQRQFTRAMCQAFLLTCDVAKTQAEKVGEIDLKLVRHFAAKEMDARECVLARKALLRYRDLFGLKLQGCGGWQGEKAREEDDLPWK